MICFTYIMIRPILIAYLCSLYKTVRVFVDMYVRPLIIRERDGLIPPKFQGSSEAPQGLCWAQKTGSHG